ncbi:peptidylprolyl isomerase [Methanotrichaceae archaeon M04Ac]|uniref:Peptidyl-prolyl cis-trans isomerase n=1 Tax=Candidatus Methanocrinis alkalitolerans TaxID=3033395 RepID=A0ABT5XE62_9EURY|nr:peptidylprolyl isomerase [Candidatus Methanocrinis alkalitolerans]MCR3883387.1 peptidylprolyl isomerase [Methanothrix sp.]MDF0592983.1 peptidylprolyl isomerase [Candidatus Methanocrinis alkalitolerans]
MKQAKEGDTVSLHYKGSFEDGTVFDSSETHGALRFTIGKGTVIPGFDEAVLGMKPGEAKTVTIAPEKGYGPRNEELLMKIDKKELPPDLAPVIGQRIEFSKGEQRLQLTVAEISEEAVTFDANHPLAGKTLVFELLLLEIEEE